MADTWKTAIIEGSMVLLGVLLALFVDSWREDREFQQLVAVTEAQIVEEIRGNRDRLISYRDDFVTRRAKLETWGESLDNDLGILEQLNGFPGIPSTFMNQSAWTMANNGQITEHLDFAFYDAAFELYASGDMTEGRLDFALKLFFDVQGFDQQYTEPLLQVMKLYFVDIISNLNSSISDHDRFLENFAD